MKPSLNSASQKLAQLVRRGERLFTAEMDLTVSRLLNVVVPARMTLVQLPHDEILVHSPINLQRIQLSSVEALGKVKHIIAPNSTHHLFAQQWKQQFPEARLYATAALAKKRSDVKWDVLIPASTGSEPSEPLTDLFRSGGAADTASTQSDVEVLPIRGMPFLSEVALFHRISRTLILTDLAFNFKPGDQSALTHLYLKLAGGYQECCVTHPFRLMIKDKPAFKQSLDRILLWDFDRVIMAHGDVVETDGKRKFAHGSYQRLLGELPVQFR